ncbi:MAG: glycosyl transferase family protein [Chthonomonadaceae bacterium]|nr:glycosyl transferase family protein [Chthonomonadaceae bacterium]
MPDSTKSSVLANIEIKPISVLICTRNRPDDIILVMPHIMAQDYPDYEVVIIDQSSDNQSEDRIKSQYGSDPRLRYIRPGTVGLSIARNQALAEARHEICAFTDDDVEVPTDWLTKVNQTFNAFPETDVLFSPVLAPHDRDQSQDLYFASLYFHEARVLNKGELFGMGANMMLRKSFFEKVGPFDALLGAGAPLPGSDEHDWLYRAHMIDGIIRLEPDNCIEHRAPRTFDQWLRVNYLCAFGDAAFAVKHLRCGDLKMLRVILHRLAIEGLRVPLKYCQRRGWRFNAVYVRRYWLGIWGSLKYRVDRSTRLFVSPEHAHANDGIAGK